MKQRCAKAMRLKRSQWIKKPWIPGTLCSCFLLRTSSSFGGPARSAFSFQHVSFRRRTALLATQSFSPTPASEDDLLRWEKMYQEGER